ncbi:MAG TPA: dihydroneopterin aldolase [Candidatus Limnocylindria bacterium]|nr:dihydroneopterin aldolase [Candidatus Limnocylindria bacterium]
MGERATDQINLRGMRFLGRHGVSLAERMEPQPFEVDVALGLDTAAAGASDDLADTVDYAAVFDQVRAAVEGSSFRLIEALAGRIAADLLAAHPRVESVEVAVRKPRAPLPGQFESVEVRIRRSH